MATQSELRWLQENPSLVAQFGSANPPNGQVAQFVKQWYDGQGAGAPAPDATDSAILGEFGMSTPNWHPPTNTAQPTSINFGNLIAPNVPTTPPMGPTVPGQAPAQATAGNISFPAAAAAQPVAPPPTPATSPALPTGNFSQGQNAQQTGAFNTQGLTNTNQAQTTSQANSQQQTGFNNLIGTNAQQQQQAQQSLGGSNQSTQNYGTTAQQQAQQGTTAQQQQQVGATAQQGQTTGTQQQQGVTGETSQQQQNQTGTTNQVGTNVAHETGNVNTSGTQTTRANDSLGFGALLQGQQGNAQATDASRNAFLTDFVNTGGSGFNSQVDQAVRNSLTGPQMTGAGDSARARASGYAAAQIARNNAGERLSAAQQLAGPTAVEQLSTTANPYIGQTTSTTGNENRDLVTRSDSNVAGTNSTSGNTTGSTQGFSNLIGSNTGTSNTTGQSTEASNMTGQNAGTSATTGQQQGTSNTQATNFQNLLSQMQSAGQNTQNQTSGSNTTGTQQGFSSLIGSTAEQQKGNASGTSSQQAAGQIPQAQQVSTGGGGCVLCTAGIELGLWRNTRLLRRVIDYKLNTARSVYRPAARGYFFLFTPLAAWLLSHPRIASWLAPLAKAVVYQELRLSGRRLPRSEWASFVHDCGHTLCHWIGKFPVPGRVTDPRIESIARKNNIWFSLS